MHKLVFNTAFTHQNNLFFSITATREISIWLINTFSNSLVLKGSQAFLNKNINTQSRLKPCCELKTAFSESYYAETVFFCFFHVIPYWKLDLIACTYSSIILSAPEILSAVLFTPLLFSIDFIDCCWSCDRLTPDYTRAFKFSKRPSGKSQCLD